MVRKPEQAEKRNNNKEKSKNIWTGYITAKCDITDGLQDSVCRKVSNLRENI